MTKMIRVLSFLISITFFFSVSAQSKRDISKYNIKSSTVTVDEPDKNDNMISRTDRVYTWDKSGNLTKEFEYSKDGKLKKGVEIKYGKANKVMEEIYYNESENIEEKINYSYNRLNKKTEEIVYNGSNEIIRKTKFEYNGFGELISEATTDKNGNILSQSLYEYDN